MENNIFENVNMQESLQTARELGTPVQQMPQQLTPEQIQYIQQQHTTMHTPVQQSLPMDTPSLPEGHMTGIIVNTQELIDDATPKPVQVPQALDDDRMELLSEYMKEYDERIEEAKEKYEQTHGPVVESDNEDDDNDNEDQQETFLKDYSEAVVVIDKTGMGVVNFTDEERAKLEKVKKIKVEEVESLELSTIVTKKVKKKNVAKILQKTKNTIKTTSIVLPASGYTAEIRGCSAHELLGLITDGRNPLHDNETKWSLIYSKIESTSIGTFKDFNDFLTHTSTLDYQTFIFGILCATYPEDDSIPLTCQKCNKEFDHHYSIKSLIRAERMDSDLQNRVANIIDASHMLPTALECHENAPVNEVKRYRLPYSEFIVDLHVQSVHDFIYESVKKLSEKRDSNMAQASVLSTGVRSFFVPQDDGSFIELDEPEEITEVIYKLNDIDIKVLNTKMQDLISGKQFDFGFMDMTCPHCRNYVDTLPMDVEKILFFKYQMALNTEVE